MVDPLRSDAVQLWVAIVRENYAICRSSRFVRCPMDRKNDTNESLTVIVRESRHIPTDQGPSARRKV
jgi:hypothetical protein